MKDIVLTFILGLFVTALLAWIVWGLAIISSALNITIDVVLIGFLSIIAIYGIGVITRELSKEGRF